MWKIQNSKLLKITDNTNETKITTDSIEYDPEKIVLYYL